MTEMTDTRGSLPSSIEKFVLQWRTLGNAWGVNRSVSQIHAAVHAERPLTAEDIAETLGVARSNVSTSLKELTGLGAGAARRGEGRPARPFRGRDRRLEIAALTAVGRKQREINPELVAQGERGRGRLGGPSRRQRLEAMLTSTETLVRRHEQMAAVPKSKLVGLISHGAEIIKFLLLGEP